MDYRTFGVHYRDLKTWFHEQEARNLPLHEAQPSAVLIIEFSIRERVLVNRNNKPTKSALAVRRQRFKQLERKKLAGEFRNLRKAERTSACSELENCSN